MSVKQFAEMVESIALIDMKTTPVFQFKMALKDELMKNLFSREDAEEIAALMKVELSEFDIENEYWNRVVKGYATLVCNVHDLVQDTFCETISRKVFMEMVRDFSVRYA